VPGGLHGLDDPANDKLSTFLTAGSKENMKVMFTVFSSLKLVEDSVWERAKTLGTYETL